MIQHQVRGLGRRPKHLLLTSFLAVGLLLLAACSPTPSQEFGSLQITVEGLSAGANIAVTGPAGYSATVTTSTTLDDLVLGDYSLEASPAANFFVSSDSTKNVAVVVNTTASASFTYSQAFAFSADADANTLSLGGSTELVGTLTDLHADLTNAEVQLTQPGGWDLSVSGPWPVSSADSISTFITDDAATVGANDFVFSVSGEIAGQILQHDVIVSVDLLPIVTTAVDDVASPAQGSLRWLVENPRVEGHTITFDPALAVSSQLVIALQGQLDIRQPLNIAGFDAPDDRVQLTPAGGMSFRLLDIAPVDPADEPFQVELSRLELVGGSAPGTEHGGAIRSKAELRVTDNLFLGNEGRYGGAVRIDGGSFTAVDTAFENNVASSWGGAVSAANATLIELRDSEFSFNQAVYGGAVLTGNGSPPPANRAELLIVNTNFVDNTAAIGGGALSNYAIAMIQNSTFDGNAAASGGAIGNHYRMTIEDHTVVRDNDASHYGGILNDGILHVRDSVVDGNTALAGDGGGIYNGWAGGDLRVDNVDLKSLSVINSQIVNNSASGDGGGIYNVQLLEIVDSTFESNSADGNGGGGGVYSRSVTGSDVDNQRGTVHVSGSTFNDNFANDGSGGAIAIDVPAPAPGPEFEMVNSTVADNTAFADGGGISLARRGGAFGDDGVFGSISFSTIALNTSVSGYGGGVYTRYGELKVRGNIIASNVLLRAGANDFELDLYAYADATSSLGYNWLTSDPQSGLQDITSDVIGQPASLGSLADNGGPTATLMPLATALGDVPLAECVDGAGESLTTDQRGFARPGPDTMCYRGAVEPE